MKKYSVTEIAMLLSVNNETVRRWIRLGYLKSTFESKKKGHLIDEFDLYEFVKDRPKYRSMLGLDSIDHHDPYVDELEELLVHLIAERDKLNAHINKIQVLLEEL